MLLDLSPSNKKTLNDISEPAMWHEYWSEGFLVQQLSLKHLNMDVRYNMTMHWRSLTIVLEAYHIYDQMLLHLGLYYI